MSEKDNNRNSNNKSNENLDESLNHSTINDSHSKGNLNQRDWSNPTILQGGKEDNNKSKDK